MSSTVAQTDIEPLPKTEVAHPYSPSWVDRLTDRVRQLRIPAWLVYLSGAVVIVLLYSAVKWSEGSSRVGEFFPFHVLSAVTPFYAIALVHYLDNWASEALANFRPAMSVGDVDYEKLNYRLTTLPSRPAVIVTILGALYGAGGLIFLSPQELLAYRSFGSPVSVVTDTLLSAAGYAMAGILIYHSVRQLSMVSRIYTQHARIDLFQSVPLYAFSVLSARTAIGFGIVSYAWTSISLALAGASANVLWIVELGIFTVVIVTIFIWPLLGVHKLMQQEKKRLKASNALQIKGVITELHRRREAGDYGEMAGINEAMESLLKEQGVLDKISTWPWQPETIRGVGTAILLPILIWAITRVLERFVVF